MVREYWQGRERTVRRGDTAKIRGGGERDFSILIFDFRWGEMGTPPTAKVTPLARADEQAAEKEKAGNEKGSKGDENIDDPGGTEKHKHA